MNPTLQFHPSSGLFTSEWGLPMPRFTLAIHTRERRYTAKEMKWKELGPGRFQGAHDFFQVTLQLAPARIGRGTTLSGSIRAKKAVSLERIDLLSPVEKRLVSPKALLVHGHTMGGCSMRFFPSPAWNGAEGKTKPKEEKVESWSLTVMKTPAAFAMASFDLKQEHPCLFTATLRSAGLSDFSATMQTPIELAKGASLALAPLTLSTGPEGHPLLITYGLLQATGRGFSARAPVMWNTWDYYRASISEAEVMANVDFIARDPVLKKHIEYITVDDGWQHAYGDWEANYKFPSGMDGLAKKIRKKGFKPGLWFAPFIVEEHATIADWHEGMLARGDKGIPGLPFQCMKRNGFILDPAAEPSKKFLTELFARYARWGYAYYKLDFVRHAQNAVYNAGKRLPKGKLMQDAFALIRKAVGKNAHVLGCNYPFETGAGPVDSARVSSDISPRWRSVKENVKSIAARFWMNRVLWWSDPDFAVCRGDETSKDPDLRRMHPLNVYQGMAGQNEAWNKDWETFVDFEEAKVLLSLTVVHGGVIALSDKLTRLNPRGLDLVRKTVSAVDCGPGIPLDLFERELPEHWVQDHPNGARRLVVNFSENAKALSLDALDLDPALPWRDFWTKKPVSIAKKGSPRKLPPHSCLFLESIASGSPAR
ncbi:MAG: alpha-galactosidase [Spirochaetes bacterium]|nr:alpha-galactosidase [Spirochaetota bacterium]